MATSINHHQEHQLTADAQRQGVHVLARLFDEHPDLPSLYVTVQEPWPNSPLVLDLMVATADGFELWREALGIDMEAVSLVEHRSEPWLAASTTVSGVKVRLTSHSVTVPVADEAVAA